MTMQECCQAIYDRCPNQYAKSYALAWLDGRVAEEALSYGILPSDATSSHAARILCNVGKWHGDEAKAVRAALKQLAR